MSSRDVHHARAAVLVLLVIVSVIPVVTFGQERESDRHPYESYTEPFRRIEVAASDTGRVAEVRIKRGDVVKSGQLLLKLDTSILETTRRVAQADADASAKEQALTVAYEAQKRRLQQYAALAESGRGSSEELLGAEADEQVALYHLKAAQEERAKRRLALEEIEARIAARSVRSPIDGIVIDVVKDVGEFVAPSEPEVATIVDLHMLRASFFLPTNMAFNLRRNHVVTLSLVETEKTLEALIEYVGATTEADSGRVRVDVVIDNQKGQHRSGLRCLLERTSLINPVIRAAQRPEVSRE